MTRRFLYLRLLRWVLAAGALYDLGFALLMAGAPEAATDLFDLALPGETFWSQLLAVHLLMLGVLYFAAAREPRRYSAIIVVAVAGRLLGAVVLGSAAWRSPGLAGLWPVAGSELFLSLATGWLWRAWRR